MKDLVSVIIPVYNVEKFLSKCIKSIINQTYKNIEIILVDDGSTDHCLEICKRYESVDTRISVYTKKNGGLSSARNYGVECASGEYIIFVDSDDFVKNTYVEHLHRAIKDTDSDIAISNFLFANEQGNIIGKSKNSTLKIEVMDVNEALKQLLIQKKFDSSAWAKIYTRQFFEKYKYPEGKLYEDLPVTYRMIYDSKKIAYIDAYDYYYVQRSNSILNMDFNEKKMDLVVFVNEMYEFFYKYKPELLSYAGTRCFSSLINLWRGIPLENTNNQKVWKQAMVYRLYPLRLVDAKLKIKIGAVSTFFGRKFSYFVMKK